MGTIKQDEKRIKIYRGIKKDLDALVGALKKEKKDFGDHQTKSFNKRRDDAIDRNKQLSDEMQKVIETIQTRIELDATGS